MAIARLTPRFGQVTWSMSDAARLTLGGRYTHEIKNARRVNDVINTTTGEFDITQAIFASCAFGIDYDTLGQASNFFPLPDCLGNPPPSAFTTRMMPGTVAPRTRLRLR